ncbi:MAG: hypothetical protein ACXWMN_02105 [Candidatus Limnocylindria bacterium]
MNSRIRILGFALALFGIAFLAVGAFTYVKQQEGVASLNAFSEKQNVKLAYDDKGTLGGANPEEAAGIMALLTEDWKYPVNKADFDPKDPIVNTASEYMYQMAMISYHVMHGTQTIVFTEDQKAADGTVIPAGSYDFPVDGRYYADFNRANPIEGAARDKAWSPTALGLIGQLGVGTTTASALQLAFALAVLFAGVGFITLLLGVGLVWASRVTVPALVERTAPVVTPVAGFPAPVSGR